MKVTVYMAISIDGRITKGKTDSDWVSPIDAKEFKKVLGLNDAVIMGRKTMDQFENNFPINGIYNIVLSKNSYLHRVSDNLEIKSATPIELITYLKNRGFERILIIGGASVNEQFIKAKLVDEIILSVHPLVIGDGLGVFGSSKINVNLEYISSKIVENQLVQIVYKVNN